MKDNFIDCSFITRSIQTEDSLRPLVFDVLNFLS